MSLFKLFTLSLGLPDNSSGKLLTTAYWVLIPDTIFMTRLSSPRIFSTLPIIVIIVVAVFLLLALVVCISTFKGRDESPPVAFRTAYSVIHTHSLSPVHSWTRDYPRHHSWKKSPGTVTEFIYSPQRDFHVNLPRTFVTLPIMDW